ncbi:NUDIX hydrolase [Microbacteriaceae bacterium 4G12]
MTDLPSAPASTPRMRVGAYAVIRSSGRVLLAHWNDRGGSGWTLPGGGLELGEEPLDGVVREVAEETGYAVAVERLLGVDTITIPGNRRLDGSGVPYFGVRIFYRASIAGGMLENEREGSTDEARWFAEEDVPGLTALDIVRVGLELDRTEPPTGSILPRP